MARGRSLHADLFAVSEFVGYVKKIVSVCVTPYMSAAVNMWD